MGKKILVISTSLREGSNSDLLAEAFLKGAREVGHKVEKVSLKDKTIGFCKGCLACQKTGNCVIRDDAGGIVEKMLHADVLVFATPVYYYEMSGQMKTLLDRANPLYTADYAYRAVYLLATAADEDEHAINGARKGVEGFIACFERAYLAGLLHDSAKCMSDEKKLQICDKNHISYSSMEAEHPYLLHGKVGAYIAREKFKIRDEDILQAITWHTTGRPNMSLLEKIIFIADYIEPSRKPVKELDLIRRLAFEDIDRTMEKILSNTLKYLAVKNTPVDTMTQTTYESYKK